MAQGDFNLLFKLTLTFSLFIPYVLSRTITESSHSHTTAVLDISASVQQTLEVLSVKPTQHEEELNTTTPTSSSLLSLTIHPRSFLIKPHHNDYKSLTLSRLARDSARVNSLTTKLQLALSPLNISSLLPVETVLQPEDLQSPITSGVTQGSGEYFTRVGVGQPAKPFYLVIDTGSDINWLQCEPCSDCYQQSDPIFNPAQSSSYRPLSCGSQQCSSLDISGCRAEKCLYQVSYGDGSFTVGDLATETVSFGSSGSVPNVAIGCGHDNEGLFVGAAGLLGLGGGSLSLTSQIKATSFSYCLVNRDSSSSSTLEFNSAAPGDSVLAPLLRNSRIDTYFYVGLTGIGVGGKLLSIPAEVFSVDQSGKGGVIVDSGTSITRLQTQAYDALRDSFVKYTPDLPRASSFALFDTCYDLSSMSRVSVPTVSFQFGSGKTLSLHPKNYLIPVDSSGTFCLAFAPTKGSLSIIGNVQQQGTRVSYDLANKVVGFSSNKC
ncbi:unnamed protein product [Ilex paraguariensis]|uniref:Peptidase A1 domain-containing protein n=1 Tax=Ilex paraguariensis TaxID=185542 RepID=A0ABC8RYI7_9AQUA